MKIIICRIIKFYEPYILSVIPLNNTNSHLFLADDYDEMYLHLIIAGTEENPNSNIKVSHITVDLPIYK